MHQVTHIDFKKAKEKVMFKKKEGVPEGLYMSSETIYEIVENKKVTNI